MKKLKRYKHDILILLLFSAIYITIALILTQSKFIFASKVDFAMQHYLFPEYFRNLFYETKDLLPDFALNLGGGQNIYNLSYYGLLSPYILLSYLFPMIPMINYLMIVSFFVVVISTFLFYKFLKSHHFKESTCLVVALLFLFATPIIYHAKRHIMFMNYFPFLILGLFGVDKFLKDKKKALLIISITLMVFTSFYYSVSGIVVLIIYGIYQYLKDHKFNKNIIKFLFSFSIPFFIAILISSILWLPTAYTLLTGRGESVKQIQLWQLILPNLKSLYTAYSPGITLLEFILIGILLLDKNIKKQVKVLAGVIIVIFLFPLFNYILNGTLYLNAKSLIPFLPLALLLVAISLEHIKHHQKKIKVFLVISTSLICVVASFNDILIPKGEVTSNKEKNYAKVVDEVTKEDKSFYRIGNQTSSSTALNKVYNIKEYKSSIYSSTQNSNYQKWLRNKQKNNQMYRNNMMTSIEGNILSEAIMGEKYIITDKTLNDGYQLKAKKGSLKLYENEFYLPILYATKDNLSNQEYKNLTYPMSVIASYLNKVPEEELKLETVNLETTESNKIETKKMTNSLFITAKEDNKLILTPTTSLKDKVVFITFKNRFNQRCNHTKEDQWITINKIKNKLTCKGWKYHNQNEIFHYVLVSPEKLEITFAPGLYELEEISIYAVEKDIFLTQKENFEELTLDRDKTKGDTIYATVNLKEEKNVVASIPYDEAFQIEVDGKEISYQKSIQNTITFPIEKGNHEIKITYHAPWKNIGIVLSIAGIILLIIVAYCDKRKINNKRV